MLARELEQQPRVDRPEHRAALQGALAQAGYVLEQPLDLGTREVGVEHEAGALAHERLAAGGAKLVAAPCGAPVLPHDRRMKRIAADRVPHAHGLALVGYADCRQIPLADPGLGERLAGNGVGDLPDLTRVLLDPARPRKRWSDLARRAGDGLGPLIEDEARRRRGPLVDREDHVGREPNATPGALPLRRTGLALRWPRSAESRDLGCRSC